MLTKLLTAWGTGRIGSFLAGRLKLAYIVLNLRLLSVYIPIGLPYTSPTGSQDTLPSPSSMPSSLVVRRRVSSRSSSFLAPSIIRSLMSTLVSSSQIEM